MSKLDFLEVSRNFKSYYRTLRDVHFYLTNDSELNPAELQAVSKVLSKLIYGFIRINGIAFREMNREQYEREFHLFHEDFLSVIQNSGENNVEMDQFIALIDEIMEIAVKRRNALAKIKKVKQESLGVELTEVIPPVFEELVEIEADLEEEVEEIVDDINEEAPEVETVNAAVEVEDFTVEVAIVEQEKAEEEQLVNDIIIADVIIEEAVAPELAEKVENPRIDGGPVNNSFNDYESSDHFRFRPRKRKNR